MTEWVFLLIGAPVACVFGFIGARISDLASRFPELSDNALLETHRAAQLRAQGLIQRKARGAGGTYDSGRLRESRRLIRSTRRALRARNVPVP